METYLQLQLHHEVLLRSSIVICGMENRWFLAALDPDVLLHRRTNSAVVISRASDPEPFLVLGGAFVQLLLCLSPLPDIT